MSALKAAYDSFKALYTADTGSGGLNESGGDGTAKVHAFVRSRDRTAQSASDAPLPNIRFEAFLPENDAIGVERVDGIVRMVVSGNVDRDGDKLDVIDARLRAVYHESTPTASGWSITKPVLVRVAWLPVAREECRLLHEYRFKACKS